MIPGDYVVIQSTPPKARYLAEIARVIDHEHEMFYRAHNVWPREFDVSGYVERLAEKIQRAEEAEKSEKKTKKEKKQCDPPESGSSKKKKEKKPEKCKHSKKADKKCLANTPLFVEEDFEIDLEKAEGLFMKELANDATNTNTGYGNNYTGGAYSRPRPNRMINRSSGCCNCESCCGKMSGKAVGSSGTELNNVVVRRDRLPPMLGNCIPWMSSDTNQPRNQPKKLC